MITTRRVLVLDDDEANRILLEVALKTQGFLCEGARTGAEALEKARQTRFDIALIDVNLPDMNGLEVACRLRDADPSIVIISATIDDDDATIRRAKATGCDVFMVKPFDLDVLLHFLTTLDPIQVRRSERLQIVDNTGVPRFH